MIKLFVMKKMILTIAMIAGMSAIANIQTLQGNSKFKVQRSKFFETNCNNSETVGTEPNPPLSMKMLDSICGGMTSVSPEIGGGIGIEKSRIH